jgi:hypothetical protein
MSEFQYKAGLSNVGSYQVSGIPFVTSSLAPVVSDPPVKISFPTVTKFIIVKNVNASNKKVRVGFSSNGVVGTNYFLLSQNESFTADVKVSSIFIVGNGADTVDVSIVAGLTGIDSLQLPNNWSGSAGVG